MTAISQSSSAEKPKNIPQLSLKTKLAYGAGDLNAAIASAMTGFFLTPFLYDVAGLRPAIVGLIFLIGKVWDAITDPLAGHLSDNTNTRWGRRRAWLLFGAIPFAVTYFLLWFVPDLTGDALFWYFLVVILLFRLAFTIVNVPYTSLTPELTDDYDERTSLTTYRFSFSILGGMTAVILHPIIVGFAGDNVELGHLISATVWGIIIALSAWIAYFGTEEKIQPYAETAQEALEKSKGSLQSAIGNFGEILRIVFTNRPYLFITGIYSLSWMAVQIIQINLLLYVRYWLDAEGIFPLFVLVLQVTAFSFLVVWGRISKHLGKNQVYALGASIWLIVMLGIFLVQPGQVGLLFLLSFLAGAGTSVAYLMPWSMLPDVIEYSELTTGQRNEGVYYGFFVFLQKLAIAAGVAVSGFALEWAGYVNAEDGVLVAQPDDVLLMLRLLVSVVPAILLTLSLPLAFFFPIDRDKFQEIRKDLIKKRESEALE